MGTLGAMPGSLIHPKQFDVERLLAHLAHGSLAFVGTQSPLILYFQILKLVGSIGLGLWTQRQIRAIPQILLIVDFIKVFDPAGDIPEDL